MDKNIPKGRRTPFYGNPSGAPSTKREDAVLYAHGIGNWKGLMKMPMKSVHCSMFWDQ